MTPAAVLGIVFAAVTIGGGIVMLAFRARIAAWNAQANRDSFGSFGERVAKNSTPAWVAIVGIGLILVGVVTVLRVIFPGTS